ncbi:MAG: methionyl-tRNA formyltransferase [Pseudomonadota bacterium]
MSFRIVFMGTPDFSVPVLSHLISAGHDVAAVYSQPPRPKGRGMDVRKSPVQECAEQMGIPVHTPKSLKISEAQEVFISHYADLAVVVAYGLILPKAILDAPKMGCFNIHASLLPRWRGAAPIQRAIMAGDQMSGVMIMKMDEGLDTGDICLVERIEIGANTTAGELHDKLSHTGADLITRSLAALSRDSLMFTQQPEEGVTYAEKIKKAEAKISWAKSAQEVHNHIRGLSPFPGAWFEATIRGKQERVKVLLSVLSGIEKQNQNAVPGTLLETNLTIACATGKVQLLQVQRGGKKPMSGEEFLRGVDLEVGTVFANRSSA